MGHWHRHHQHIVRPPRNMESLSESLISSIFNQLSLRDALHASYVCTKWQFALRPYLCNTYDIHKYLSCFANPESLLRVFRTSGAILSGSQALSYFLPAQRVYTQNSDWDIFVPYPHQQLLHEELLLQGFHPVERTKKPRKPGLFQLFDYRNASKEKVQLVALTSKWNLFDCLMQFHISIVQNFISGWGCGCIHWASTLSGKGWMAKRLDPTPGCSEQELRELDEYKKGEIRKYGDRGIRLVTWGERDVEERSSDFVFVVYFAGKGKESSHAYVPLEELKQLLDFESK